MYKRRFTSLFLWGSIALLLFFCSCKSHKKIKPEVEVYVGEQIDIKPQKHDKQKKKIGEKIARECKSWVGTPYGFGRNEKGVATDCSGMVVIVYDEVAGIKLPRNSAEQCEYCTQIEENDIEAGDLVFFATGSEKGKVSHVGVMIDKDQFVHASGSKGVIISEMTTPYYRRTFLCYGRVPQFMRD